MIENNFSGAIQIWPFGKAPFAYQKLSDNGGDEDRVAFIPKAMAVEELPCFEIIIEVMVGFIVLLLPQNRFFRTMSIPFCCNPHLHPWNLANSIHYHNYLTVSDLSVGIDHY